MLLQKIIMLGEDGTIAEGDVLLLHGREGGRLEYGCPGGRGRNGIDRLFIPEGSRDDFLAGRQVSAVFEDEVVEVALA
jgi:hypothetical protein